MRTRNQELIWWSLQLSSHFGCIIHTEFEYCREKKNCLFKKLPLCHSFYFAYTTFYARCYIESNRKKERVNNNNNTIGEKEEKKNIDTARKWLYVYEYNCVFWFIWDFGCVEQSQQHSLCHHIIHGVCVCGWAEL